MHTILFVCTGNTCRSPMAEALFNNKIKKNERLKNEYIADSVGIYADVEAKKASENSIKIMKEYYEIDITNHEPTQFTDKYYENAEFILCMSDSHVQYIRNKYASSGNTKTYTLKEFVGLNGYVSDPYGGNENAYKNCADEIDKLINLLIEKLEKNKEEKA